MTPSRLTRLRPKASGFSTKYGLENAGAVWTGTMTVMPSMVRALWSDGPAPPRRLSWPALGSTSRTPQDCNSLINCAVGMAVGTVGFIRCTPGRWGGRRGGSPKLHRSRRAIIENEMKEFGPGIMADRVHHPLALDDEAEIEIGHQDSLALGQRWHHMGALRRHNRGH